jgi:hypothetical protein
MSVEKKTSYCLIRYKISIFNVYIYAPRCHVHYICSHFFFLILAPLVCDHLPWFWRQLASVACSKLTRDCLCNAQIIKDATSSLILWYPNAPIPGYVRYMIFAPCFYTRTCDDCIRDRSVFVQKTWISLGSVVRWREGFELLVAVWHIAGCFWHFLNWLHEQRKVWFTLYY